MRFFLILTNEPRKFLCTRWNFCFQVCIRKFETSEFLDLELRHSRKFLLFPQETVPDVARSATGDFMCLNEVFEERYSFFSHHIVRLSPSPQKIRYRLRYGPTVSRFPSEFSTIHVLHISNETTWNRVRTYFSLWEDILTIIWRGSHSSYRIIQASSLWLDYNSIS